MIKVIHFQRRPRPGFNFSIESIFESLRCQLKNKIDFKVEVCSRFNDGYVSKAFNIIEAALLQQKNTVLHITGEMHFLNLLMRKKNVLLTIHDCRFMERKTSLQKKMTGWLYLKAPVKKAAYITTVSLATKEAVMRYTGCHADKIQVVPAAISQVFQPAPKAFNKSCPAILQVGAAENKNLARLAEAIKNIPCRLVIAGNVHTGDMEKLRRYEIDFTVKSNLSTEALYQEYINCDLLAFVSVYEGFGMPVIEANAVERPVLASNISAMPEVAGDAACLVDPHNVDAIRQGLLQIIYNDAYREQLIMNGRKNRQRFDAVTIADAYYQLYKKIAAAF
ncbi:glycosyltransferase family 4 protein [Parafilimonas sp.]|uniref:glycosyltransferase family 4 protein n=1 Tax=Parafilimonas sp. TaxID=1969739 RepID=UPI0039E55C89